MFTRTGEEQMIKHKKFIPFNEVDVDFSHVTTTQAKEFYKTIRKRRKGIDFYPKTINEEIRARIEILKLIAKTNSIHILDKATSPTDFIWQLEDSAEIDDSFDNIFEPYWQLITAIDASQESAHYVYYWYQSVKSKIPKDMTNIDIRLLLKSKANNLAKGIR